MNKARYGSHSFEVAASIIWNNLPLDIHNSPSICCFHHQMKTCFYNVAF